MLITMILSMGLLATQTMAQQPEQGLTDSTRVNYYKLLAEYYGAQVQYQTSLTPEQKDLINGITQKAKSLDAAVDEVKKSCISEGKILDEKQRINNNTLVCINAPVEEKKGPNNK